MTSLVRIAANLRAVLAPYVAFQFMDRRRLRPTHDIQRDCLMRVAAKAFDFKIEVTSVEGVAEGRGWSRRSLKAKHALVPGFAGELIRLLACPSGPLGRCPDRTAVDGFSGFGAPNHKLQRGESWPLPVPPTLNLRSPSTRKKLTFPHTSNTGR